MLWVGFKPQWIVSTLLIPPWIFSSLSSHFRNHLKERCLGTESLLFFPVRNHMHHFSPHPQVLSPPARGIHPPASPGILPASQPLPLSGIAVFWGLSHSAESCLPQLSSNCCSDLCPGAAWKRPKLSLLRGHQTLAEGCLAAEVVRRPSEPFVQPRVHVGRYCTRRGTGMTECVIRHSHLILAFPSNCD